MNIIFDYHISFIHTFSTIFSWAAKGKGWKLYLAYGFSHLRTQGSLPHINIGRKGYDSALLVSCTILFCQGCHNVIKGGLNNRNLLLEAGSPSSHQGWFLVRLSFWLADGRLRTLCSQGLSSVGTWTETSSGVSSPYKGISPIGLGCCTYDLI